ncbi:MAG: hypothetical protein IID45_15835 [Planctomycetes bacterium]|nr:hypothetical protein [Planctomycetota bacterium]
MTDDFQNEMEREETDFDTDSMIEIPRLLYSQETDRPFERCIDCGADLLAHADENLAQDARFYQIHKVIVRNEAVFEFAMCMPCQESLRGELSEETSKAIIAFCRERLSPHTLIGRETLDDCIARCAVCRRDRSECHRYSLSGLCLSVSLLLRPGPIMLCDGCEIQIAELVSKKTRDTWDRFVEDHFDSPPGVESDHPNWSPVLI